ncbi:MAG: Uma2 family endonuclease [Fimbriimonadales bacterium]|nr:Uma2 family endonuclease [Fimbriimonadales bacterium]
MGKVAVPRTPVRHEPSTHKRLFTRTELERMEDAGMFHPEERIELIGGELFRKELPLKSPHATAIRLCEVALRQIFGEGYDVRSQLPLTLSERDEPMPDLAVVPGSIRDYERHHPTTALLVVEISEVTLRFDRRVKASLYAWAGIPDYWIVNLVERVVEVFREPAPMQRMKYGFGYLRIDIYRAGDSLAPLASPETPIPVEAILPAE